MSTPRSKAFVGTLPQPWQPRKYQLKAVKFLLEHACAGLLLDPGLGKTSITLAALSFLKKRKLIGKVLLIAPLRPCYTVWPNEIKKWADFNHLTYAIAHGPTRDEALRADVDIVIINPEGIDKLLGVSKEKHGKRLSVSVDMKLWKSYGFDMLVVDELSKFKHHQTSRFKAMKHVLHTFSRRWGLTGSPAANGLLDLFGQAYMLDMGLALTPYITRYRETFFVPDKYGFDWTIMEGAEERIYERLSPLVLRMGDDVLDMPELVENNIFVTLPESVRAIYDAIEKDFITALENRTVTAQTAAAASTKLRQIANGGVFLDPQMLASGLLLPKSQREWADLHSEKTIALRDLVDELQGSPLLVAYDFEHDLARLRDAFKEDVFACDYNMKQFTKLEAAWNAGDIPLLFGHPQSVGHGLNLQGSGHHVAWHSMTWNLELYEQFIRRVYRQGNKHKRVFVHHIMATGTIDEVIYGTLKIKDGSQKALFDGLLRWAKERRRVA